jgi:xanthine dehydrogenase YagR molybdenum-binding subunit
MGRRVTFTVGLPGDEREVTVELHEDPARGIPEDVSPWGREAKLRVVGTDVPRTDGLAKVTGTARYTMDVHRPGQAWAGFVVSPHAHANVVSVDVSAAQLVGGVLGVRTFEGRRVTHAGQIVAAVCAESPSALDDALAAIEVEYEVRPHAVTVEQAQADGAPSVDAGEAAARTDRRASVRPDEARQALAEAEVSVAGTWRTQVQTHSALEPHGTVSEIDGDTATVWASTQATEGIAGGMARALGIASGRIRVITEHMGGGFGAKFGVQAWDQIAGQFARETGRPVYCMLPRRLEHLVGGNRPDSIQELALAGRRDGTFTALVGRTSGTAGNGAGGAGCTNTRVYRFPKIAMEQTTVPTFTERGAAFRAPGHPQGLFALEGLVDLFAARIGMDPLALRLRNDPHPVRQAQWRVGAERIGWKERRAATPAAGPVKRGVGCGAAIWYQKGGGSYNVDVRIERDGAVSVMNGAQDIGTGTRTVLAILVAEELGLRPHDVTVRLGDTTWPPGPGSGGSKTAPSLGPAAREAGHRAGRALAALLAAEWGVAEAEVELGPDGFRGPGSRRAAFRQACGLIGDEGLQARGTRRPNYDGYENETAGCQFAEVTVDVETGVVKVEKVVAVHDCGRVVDTLTSRSQVHGGVIQGISYALYEERRLDENLGDMVNPTFDTYRIAGVADVPEIDVVLTDLVSGFNNVGMMGLGEPTTVPTAAAIANAVFHAIGAQVRELPLTPARVLAALGRA